MCNFGKSIIKAVNRDAAALIIDKRVRCSAAVWLAPRKTRVRKYGKNGCSVYFDTYVNIYTREMRLQETDGSEDSRGTDRPNGTLVPIFPSASFPSTPFSFLILFRGRFLSFLFIFTFSFHHGNRRIHRCLYCEPRSLSV